MKTPALRYDNLYKQINKFKPRTIMEIGVWMGNTAVKMIETAKQYHPTREINYVGFDLFEDITEEEIVKEHSKATKASYDTVHNKLSKTGVKIDLHRGYTKDTLWGEWLRAYGFIDFIFIDGGHSPETIQNDWDGIQKFIGPNTIVIFDDYFYDKVDLGCKLLIDSLDRSKWKVNLLEPIDHFPKEGWTQHTQMVKVVPYSSSSSSSNSESS